MSYVHIKLTLVEERGVVIGGPVELTKDVPREFTFPQSTDEEPSALPIGLLPMAVLVPVLEFLRNEGFVKVGGD